MPKYRGPGRPKGHKRKKDVLEENEDEYKPLLTPEAKRGIAIVFFLTLGTISLLSLFDLAGLLGIYLRTGTVFLFGWSLWLAPVVLFSIAYFLIMANRRGIGFINYFGLILFILSFNGLLHLKIPAEAAREIIGTSVGGGYLGLFLSWPLQKIMGFWATLAVLIGLMLIALIIIFNTSLKMLAEKSLFFNQIFVKIKNLFSHKAAGEEEYFQENEEYEETENAEEAATEVPTEKTSADLKAETNEAAKNFSTKKVPDDLPGMYTKKYKKIDIPLDLLVEQKDKPSAGDIKVGAEKIRKTLETFGIDVEMAEISIGPTVTQYTLKPADGVKLSQITTLHNDMALALAAHPIRIEAPIPGKSLVGIEVPNLTIATVGLREILSSKEFALRKSNISVALGKDVAGKPWLASMESMPHLLIAGATGSGKTVCINTIIVSLLYQNSPNTLRLIMVDPKRVELPVYNGIPHLLTPVVTDVKKTINVLKWTISEMDRRFELLAKTGHRDIHSYNKIAKDKMPFLVLIVDELADLMQTSGAEVESYIIRLAQLARATGIHLILATQRPSVDVITGLIKANITTRIAFAVASGMDSRTILDHPGAEKLLGRGDMLYLSANLSKPKRLQGAFVSDDEIRRVVEYIKGQNGEVEYNTTITEKPTNNGAGGFTFDDADSDELLEEARELIIQAGKASASYLQRRLRVGYARAARLLDLLEEQGVIGPGDGAKAREVLVTREDNFELDREDKKHFSAVDEENDEAEVEADIASDDTDDEEAQGEEIIVEEITAENNDEPAVAVEEISFVETIDDEDEKADDNNKEEKVNKDEWI